MKLEFTKNEAIAHAHKNTAFSLREIVKYIKKHNPSNEYLVSMLEEIADESEAQEMVVRLRDEIETQ